MLAHTTPADGRSAGLPLSIAFVATCPPRQCGIATFSADLGQAIREADPRVRVRWTAIDDTGSALRYGPEVTQRIRQGDPASYAAAAWSLNEADVDVVALQHEFGLYGVWGD